jgi:PPOX class probable FMN-dependent enzyme
MTDLALDDLDRLYRRPHPLVMAKTLDHIEQHGARFIGLSPFCVISSAGQDGAQDVSPRGGEPGFVHVADRKTLLMPDRGGNNRLDSLRNLLGGSGRIGMMFLIPGIDDVFRVNGRAAAVEPGDLAAQFMEFGKPPRLILRITVEEAFLHCPKALMRSRLWDPDARIDRSALPTGSEMFSDQLGLPKPTVKEQDVVAGYRTQL